MKKLFVFLLGCCSGLILLEGALRLAGLSIEQQRSGKKAGGQIVILCTGDSFTYGYGVGRDETYPAQLQSMLNRKYPGHGFSVVNGGIVGANSRRLLSDFEDKLLCYAPKIVVVQVGGQNRYNLSGYDDKMPRLSVDYIRYNLKSMRLLSYLLGNISEGLSEYSKKRGRELLEVIRTTDFKFETREATCSIDFSSSRGHLPNLYELAENYVKETRGKNGNTFLLQLGLGYIALEKCDLEKAFAHFRKALKLKPNDTGAMLGIGYTYSQAGMFEQALDWYGTALKLYPDYGEGYNLLAQLYSDAFQPDRAVSILEDGLSHDPDFADNLFFLGELKYRKNAFSEALDLFKKAEAAGLNEEDCRQIESYRQQMDILNTGSTEVREASLLYFSAETADISSTAELEDIAWRHLVMNNYQQAQKYFSRAGDEENAAWVRKVVSREINGEKATGWLLDDLTTIKGICDKHQVRILFANYPDTANRGMLQISTRYRIPLVNNFQKFSELWKNGERRGDYFLPDTHCNARGCGVMAVDVMETLESQDWFQEMIKSRSIR
ncbi:MAG: tetratricopeptide repeat protein [Candidatus Wallbacteria bacterium]|nr:tetratricopeptide repeat protein [Candidatus Wallbacteria bacterium]